MKTSVSFGTMILAFLLAQQGSPQIGKSAPANAVTVVNYHTTYTLGCGISLIPIPDTLAQNPYVQSLGDQIQSRLTSTACATPEKAMIFVIQSRESLDTKMRIMSQDLELHSVNSTPLNQTIGGSYTTINASQTANKILGQLGLVANSHPQ